MPPKLMGIVNVTPDSFSDGGKTLDPQSALRAIAQRFDEGADAVDIGAESTRPGATPLSAEQEWQRLKPVLDGINTIRGRGIISLDTYHPQTAAKALSYDVDIINDVSGFSSAEMIKALVSCDCRIVVMHSLGVPADKSVTLPDSCDVIGELVRWARARIERLQDAGIALSRIVFDPGIGFGKTAAQSTYIVRNVSVLKTIGVPILVGHSRKSFLSGDRDVATLAASAALAEAGVDWLRVHDVAAHRRLFGAMANV